MNTRQITEATSGYTKALSADDLVEIGIPMLMHWEHSLKPALSDAVDRMIISEDPPVDIADALMDLGQFFQRLGEDIVQARLDRGLPMPAGPDDPDDEA